MTFFEHLKRFITLFSFNVGLWSCCLRRGQVYNRSTVVCWRFLVHHTVSVLKLYCESIITFTEAEEAAEEAAAFICHEYITAQSNPPHIPVRLEVQGQEGSGEPMPVQSDRRTIVSHCIPRKWLICSPDRSFQSLYQVCISVVWATGCWRAALFGNG